MISKNPHFVKKTRFFAFIKFHLNSVLVAAKQNQKFPFHFLSAPPTPPAELNQEGRNIFGFCPRESASAPEAQSERTMQSKATTRSARAKLGILLEMGSDFFKQTPPHLICFRIAQARATRLAEPRRTPKKNVP